MKVAVIGHSPLNIAPAVVADLGLRGMDVAWWPAPAAVKSRGSIDTRRGDLLSCGHDGSALVRTPDSAAQALEGAAAVIIDVPANELLASVSSIAHLIPKGALVHIQSHGYWPAMRLARAHPGLDVVWADSSGPTHAADLQGAVLTAHARRRGLRFSTIGGDALSRLRNLYPEAELAETALETGLESLNLMVHPGATIANLASFDRAANAGQAFGFYAEGNTETATRLAEALDAERGAVCSAWGVRYQSLREALQTVYGTSGKTLREAIAGCPFYAGLGSLPARAPERWATVDLPYAVIPLIRLAEVGGISVPMHRAAVAVLAAAFNLDPWSEALALQDLGVAC